MCLYSFLYRNMVQAHGIMPNMIFVVFVSLKFNFNLTCVYICTANKHWPLTFIKSVNTSLLIDSDNCTSDNPAVTFYN